MDVLLLEDDADTGEALNFFFELSGLQVRWAHNGREALQIMECARRTATPPDVLLIDLRLPDASGAQIVEQMALHGPMPPIVIYSASSPLDLGRAAQRIGASAVLRKPSGGSEIVAALRSAVDNANRRAAG